jgi:hypothetical protein
VLSVISWSSIAVRTGFDNSLRRIGVRCRAISAVIPTLPTTLPLCEPFKSFAMLSIRKGVDGFCQAGKTLDRARAWSAGALVTDVGAGVGATKEGKMAPDFS